MPWESCGIPETQIYPDLPIQATPEIQSLKTKKRNQTVARMGICYGPKVCRLVSVDLDERVCVLEWFHSLALLQSAPFSTPQISQGWLKRGGDVQPLGGVRHRE